MAEELPSFDDKKIALAIEAAKLHADTVNTASQSGDPVLADGALTVSGGCISVTVKDGEVCLKLPLGIGKKCLPVPAWIPNGTAAEACLHICTKWGIPCGVEVTVSVAGAQIVKKGFGCSC